jgi:putative transposase
MVNIIQVICEWVRFIIKLSRPGGVKSLVCENIAMRQQLMLLSRQRKRSPRLKTSDRVLLGLLGSWIRPKCLAKVAILIKPATILKFHRALAKRKYRLLFSNKTLKNQVEKVHPLNWSS